MEILTDMHTTQTEKDLKSLDRAVSRVRYLRELLQLPFGDIQARLDEILGQVCWPRMPLEFRQLEDLQTLVAQLEAEAAERGIEVE